MIAIYKISVEIVKSLQKELFINGNIQQQIYMFNLNLNYKYGE